MQGKYFIDMINTAVACCNGMDLLVDFAVGAFTNEQTLCFDGKPDRDGGQNQADNNRSKPVKL